MVEIHCVADTLPGALFIMPCPDPNLLDASLAVLAAQGIDRIVSLLSQEEVVLLGVTQEGALCESLGVRLVSFPIIDFGLPETSGFIALSRDIAHWLSEGSHAAVHCRAGIGRSGMICASSLMALGWTAEDAIARVSKARGISIPETVAQRDFIASLAEKLNQSVPPSI